ncbi:lymphocyte antigen 6C2 [Phymastichus coffea]|uniref:lymphocyte antigen 6C2 n=1 Tax=Phymastichus coffea TaxID=108790 RepID=UPI00273CD7C7|nr:lymphocyte antigen 6C2 [Phymastichus coffea]
MCSCHDRSQLYFNSDLCLDLCAIKLLCRRVSLRSVQLNEQTIKSSMARATSSSVFNALPLLLVALLACVGVAQGLRCYKCGQYNEGVGSITPCINYTATQLQECSVNAQYCIKYVSEGSIVRDCVPTCTEKEAWSTRTYCCKEDGCNGALSTTAPTSIWLSATAALVLLLSRALRG